MGDNLKALSSAVVLTSQSLLNGPCDLIDHTLESSDETGATYLVIHLPACLHGVSTIREWRSHVTDSRPCRTREANGCRQGFREEAAPNFENAFSSSLVSIITSTSRSIHFDRASNLPELRFHFEASPRGFTLRLHLEASTSQGSHCKGSGTACR